jgi:hypothetical protein
MSEYWLHMFLQNIQSRANDDVSVVFCHFVYYNNIPMIIWFSCLNTGWQIRKSLEQKMIGEKGHHHQLDRKYCQGEGSLSPVTSQILTRRGFIVTCCISNIDKERVHCHLLHLKYWQGEGSLSPVTSQILTRRVFIVTCYIIWDVTGDNEPFSCQYLRCNWWQWTLSLSIFEM